MVIGVLIGKFFPKIPDFLNRFEYANVSIPMAILIWLMIYPMMMKVDFPSIRNVGKKPKGLWITWITNWLIKPFIMYGIASLFFFVIFKPFITPDLAAEYLAGAVLLGAAPCTAMVFVWSSRCRTWRSRCIFPDSTAFPVQSGCTPDYGTRCSAGGSP